MAIVDQEIFERIRDLVHLLPIDWEEDGDGACVIFDVDEGSYAVRINRRNLLPTGCLDRDIRYMTYFLEDLKDEVLGYEANGYLDTGILIDVCQEFLDFLRRYAIGEEVDPPCQCQHPISTGDEREGFLI